MVFYTLFQKLIKSHQLHAICHQRLYEEELRLLRNSHKTFERQRIKDSKDQIEADDQFWRLWTESTTHYSIISKAWRIGQRKLSESELREKIPQSWKKREYWGTDRISCDEGDFGGQYRLPLGIGTSVTEAVGFAQAILREFVSARGIQYAISEV